MQRTPVHNLQARVSSSASSNRIRWQRTGRCDFVRLRTARTVRLAVQIGATGSVHEREQRDAVCRAPHVRWAGFRGAPSAAVVAAFTQPHLRRAACERRPATGLRACSGGGKACGGGWALVFGVAPGCALALPFALLREMPAPVPASSAARTRPEQRLSWRNRWGRDGATGCWKHVPPDTPVAAHGRAQPRTALVLVVERKIAREATQTRFRSRKE